MNITGAEHDVVGPAGVVNFPRGLEQLENSLDHCQIRRGRHDADHCAVSFEVQTVAAFARTSLTVFTSVSLSRRHVSSQIDLLPMLHDSSGMFGMTVDVLDNPSKVIRVARFKEKRLRAEVVLDPGIRGAITGFPSARHSKMRVGVFIAKRVAVIWDESDITGLYLPDHLLEAFRSEIMNGILEPLRPDLIHHPLEERSAPSADPQLHSGDHLPDFETASTARSNPFRSTRDP